MLYALSSSKNHDTLVKKNQFQVEPVTIVHVGYANVMITHIGVTNVMVTVTSVTCMSITDVTIRKGCYAFNTQNNLI